MSTSPVAGRASASHSSSSSRSSSPTSSESSSDEDVKTKKIKKKAGEILPFDPKKGSSIKDGTLGQIVDGKFKPFKQKKGATDSIAATANAAAAFANSYAMIATAAEIRRAEEEKSRAVIRAAEEKTQRARAQAEVAKHESTQATERVKLEVNGRIEAEKEKGRSAVEVAKIQAEAAKHQAESEERRVKMQVDGNLEVAKLKNGAKASRSDRAED